MFCHCLALHTKTTRRNFFDFWYKQQIKMKMKSTNCFFLGIPEMNIFQHSFSCLGFCFRRIKTNSRKSINCCIIKKIINFRDNSIAADLRTVVIYKIHLSYQITDTFIKWNCKSLKWKKFCFCRKLQTPRTNEVHKNRWQLLI